MICDANTSSAPTYSWPHFFSKIALAYTRRLTVIHVRTRNKMPTAMRSRCRSSIVAREQWQDPGDQEQQLRTWTTSIAPGPSIPQTEAIFQKSNAVHDTRRDVRSGPRAVSAQLQRAQRSSVRGTNKRTRKRRSLMLVLRIQKHLRLHEEKEATCIDQLQLHPSADQSNIRGNSEMPCAMPGLPVHTLP